jgi:hypothetical protein
MGVNKNISIFMLFDCVQVNTGLGFRWICNSINLEPFFSFWPVGRFWLVKTYQYGCHPSVLSHHALGTVECSPIIKLKNSSIGFKQQSLTQNVTCSPMIKLKYCSLGVKQQSFTHSKSNLFSHDKVEYCSLGVKQQSLTHSKNNLFSHDKVEILLIWR